MYVYICVYIYRERLATIVLISIQPRQLGPQWAGRTCGLCGNYNGNQGDDFMSESGLVEAGPQAFSQSWRINGDCESTTKHETDPCAINPKRGIHTHVDRTYTRHHKNDKKLTSHSPTSFSAICRRGMLGDDVRRVHSMSLSGEPGSIPAVLSL